MKHDLPMLRKRIDDILVEAGGLYLFEDILEAVERGDMQSFAYNDSWVVTQICPFPQKRVLDVVFAAGDEDELELLHSDVIGFARDHGCSMLMTNARLGWKVHAKANGWQLVGGFFIKDLTDGT